MVADVVFAGAGPNGLAGTVLSEHRTSMGLVRYRWWEGAVIVELLLLDQPTAILAVVPGADRMAPGASAL